MLDSTFALGTSDQMRAWDRGLGHLRTDVIDAAHRELGQDSVGADDTAAISGLRVLSIDGPGFFVLKDGSREVYARSGRFAFDSRGLLVDASGRALLTCGPISPNHPRPPDTRSTSQTLLDRICVAIFPAPQQLIRAHDGTLLATPSAGAARYYPAGGVNTGRIRAGVREPNMQMLQAQLHELWLQSGRATIEVAMAAAADGLTRTALNLVK